MEAHSGHYHPTKENFDELLRILTETGVDLSHAKVRVLRCVWRRFGPAGVAAYLGRYFLLT